MPVTPNMLLQAAAQAKTQAASANTPALAAEPGFVEPSGFVGHRPGRDGMAVQARNIQGLAHRPWPDRALIDVRATRSIWHGSRTARSSWDDVLSPVCNHWLDRSHGSCFAHT